MININRLKRITFKALITFTLLLNLITVPIIIVFISNYIRQINMEKIYDNFEEQNVVFSKALTTLIVQHKMEFTCEDVWESAREVKYKEILGPSTDANGILKMNYGSLHFLVEPIPGTVKKIWAEFPKGYHEHSQEESYKSIKQLSEVLEESSKHIHDYNDAITEFDQKNYPAALKKFKALANIYPGLTVKVGLMYKNGLGTDVDYKQAEEWFLKSADTGKTTANQELDKLYEEHIELNGDFVKIAERYLNKAQYGQYSDQKALAKMYEDGKGVTRNLVVARTLYKLSISEYSSDLEKEGTLQALKRLDKQLTAKEIEKSTHLTDTILRYGHLKTVLAEYLAQESLQDAI